MDLEHVLVPVLVEALPSVGVVDELEGVVGVAPGKRSHMEPTPYNRWQYNQVKMPIPDSELGRWSHHHAGTASKQAHVSIRDALASYTGWAKETKYVVFLQGSYKNDTNLRRDSDVDVVVQLDVPLQPRLATLTGSQLETTDAHLVAYRNWRLFRRHVLKALRAKYGDAVTSGRKSLKLAKSKLAAAADVVVTLRYEAGLAFYLPDEQHWVVSYPQQHDTGGLKKEQATSSRYKRTIRMFKTARSRLVENHAIRHGTAPSYFIECLLFNVPDGLFTQGLGQTYVDVVNYLTAADLRQFKCQNGVRNLFGPSNDQWNLDDARTFLRGIAQLWNGWPVHT